MELSTLNNNDVERVNINKLKKYQHGETPIIIMTVVVNIKRKIKLVWRKNENTKPNIYLRPIVNPNQMSLNLTYGTKMATLKKLNGCQMASQKNKS